MFYLEMVDVTKLRFLRLNFTILSLAMAAGVIMLWSCSNGAMKAGKHSHIRNVQLLSQNMTELTSIRYLTSASTNNPSNKQPVHILLTAYHRSGSSFTGDLIASQPNTFYFFEPLIHTVSSADMDTYSFFRRNGQYCLSVAGTCKQTNTSYLRRSALQNYFNRYNISESESMEQLLYRLIGNIFHCQFNDTESLFYDGNIQHYTRIAWHNYIECRRSNTKSGCLPVVANACQKSAARVIKSVRLSLDIVRPLLQRDSALKLIHLFRDPRGIIFSRLVKTEWYPLYIRKGNFTLIERHAKLLCNRMYEDVKAGRQLMGMFPNRVKLIRYEDLLSKTGNISKDHLMHFLGVSFNETRVKTNIQSLNEWVARLNINVVEIVDLYCARVYENLGYIKLADIKEDRKAFLPFIPALQSNNGKRHVDAFEIH